MKKLKYNRIKIATFQYKNNIGKIRIIYKEIINKNILYLIIIGRIIKSTNDNNNENNGINNKIK